MAFDRNLKGAALLEYIRESRAKDAMSSKERVLCTLNHEEPDRVPFEMWYTPEVEKKMMAEFGIEDPFDLKVALGYDWLVAFKGICTGFYWGTSKDYVDAWGIHWREVEHGSTEGAYTEMVEHPLSGDDSKLASYQTPDVNDPEIYKDAERLLKQYGDSHLIVAGVPCTVFEAAWYLRGMEEFLADLKWNKDYAHALLDKVMEYHIAVGKRMIEMGCPVVWTGDDVGMQDRMFIAPEIWREFIKPRYAYMFQEFRKVNPNVKTAYHCDGYLEPIIPELIEIGLDILNPVQPACMNPAEIKRKYGDKLSFWGTVDVQRTMPFGTVDDVINEVKTRIRTVAPGGGFILCSAHNVQPQTPMENIRAFHWAAKEFGKYPINA